MPRGSAVPLSIEDSKGYSLSRWIEGAVSEGFEEMRRKGKPVLHTSCLRIDWDPPLTVFDSTISNAFFFGRGGDKVLGVGITKGFNLSSPSRLGNRVTHFLESEVALTGEKSQLVMMGGWRFPSRVKGEPTRDLGDAHWFVPALTFKSNPEGNNVILSAYVTPSSDQTSMTESYRRLITKLERMARPRKSELIPALVRSVEVTSHTTWKSIARRAIASASGAGPRKIVLSRVMTLEFQDRVPISAVLKRLVTQNPDSASFAFKRRDSVFLGSTPERLISARAGNVEIDCLAASLPRGRDRASDERLGKRLLADAKSRNEHRMVVGAALSALSSLALSIEVPDGPQLKRLTAIQHLFTPIKVKLREPSRVWSLVLALWPNPAIAGDPRDEAVSWLRRNERWDRGWYSGVLGVASADFESAEFVVTIRSGLVRGRRALLYAGAGLLVGSRPDSEYEETGWKLRTMLSALGVRNRNLGAS